MTRTAVVALVLLGVCVAVGGAAATGSVADDVATGDAIPRGVAVIDDAISTRADVTANRIATGEAIPTAGAIPSGYPATGNAIPTSGDGTAVRIGTGHAVPTGGAAAGRAIAAAGATTDEAIPAARTATGDAVAASGAATASVSSTRDVAADLTERRLRQDYLLSCAGCHGLDAAGSARVPSLRGIDRLLVRPGGRAYVLRVPGVTNAPLSDDRLAALLDWIFTRFDNHTETHFTAEEVAAGRAAPFVDPKAARAALE